jgi:hypothetical protein
MSVDPSPSSDHDATEPTPSPRRRWPWILAGSALLAVAVVAAVLVSIPRDASAGIVCRSDTGWCTYIDTAHGWTVKWPKGWRLQRFEGRCPDRLSGGTFALWGAVVSNLTRDLAPPTEVSGSCSGAWDYRQLPASLVVFDARSLLTLPLPAPLEVQPDPFPWSVEDAAQMTETSAPTWGQPFPKYVWVGRVRGTGFAGGLVFGRSATPGDRALAAEMVASVASR